MKVTLTEINEALAKFGFATVSFELKREKNEYMRDKYKVKITCGNSIMGEIKEITKDHIRMIYKEHYGSNSEEGREILIDREDILIIKGNALYEVGDGLTGNINNEDIIEG